MGGRGGEVWPGYWGSFLGEGRHRLWCAKGYMEKSNAWEKLYLQLAESTANGLAIDVLTDVADEERIHAGECLRLLKELAPDEERLYTEGEKEVEEEIAKKTSKT